MTMQHNARLGMVLFFWFFFTYGAGRAFDLSREHASNVSMPLIACF